MTTEERIDHLEAQIIAMTIASQLLMRNRPMAIEQNAGTESGTACKNVSSNGAARVGTGQGSMSETVMQGTAGYVTRMSGGVGGRGREASSYPD